MNKVGGRILGIMLSTILVFSILPTAFAACDYSVTVLPGQPINLAATPNDAANYYYLWTQDPANGILPFTPTDTPILNLTAPAYVAGGINHYEITVKVTNKHPVTGTCTDMKTVCINVNPSACPLCDGDACISSLPIAPNCPPHFDYTGLEDPGGFVYRYETLPHTGYPGAVLYEGYTADYTLDVPAWAKLDQPTAANTHVCTDVKFSITDDGVPVGAPCTKTICLNWKPNAGITIDV